MNKNKIWETENLRGTLRIANRDGAAIHRYPFEIPSDKAIGPKAKQNILEAAGCVAPLSDYYCVKHWITWHVYSRITPTEKGRANYRTTSSKGIIPWNDIIHHLLC